MSQSIPEQWVFAERYRVDGPIGRGGMAEVWSGYDLLLDRRVAIKLMLQTPVPPLAPGSSEAEEIARAIALDRERFLREIRTTARLELPGIPSVYDFGVDGATGRIYLVMQLLFGQTLAEMIGDRDHRTEPWPVSWAAAVAAQVAATLVDVHRVDVVHRDIKPSNLMIAADGRVKVLDFGVAVLRGASALPRLTQVGMTVGSPPYMPPEQVLGNPVGPAADVYALGCVLHEMLTGRVPFRETDHRSYRDHHVNTPAAPVRDNRPDVPAAVDDLLLAMLAKRAGHRPEADIVYETLLPFAASGPAGPGDRVDGERDPRRPFLRPLAPARRPRGAAPAGPRIPTARPATPPGHPKPGHPAPGHAAVFDHATAPGGTTPAWPAAPLTADEALELLERVSMLVADQHLHQAIHLLDEAVTRGAEDDAAVLQIQIDLATTLYLADEYGRAAAVLGALLPALGDQARDFAELYYYAGASHAEIGGTAPAIEYLTRFLVEGGPDPRDPLCRDAMYQLGMLLAADGRAEEGLRHLTDLRPLLVTEYGPRSVHVTTLDRRISQIRQRAGDRGDPTDDRGDLAGDEPSSGTSHPLPLTSG